MKKLKVIWFILILLTVGELLLRFDKNYDLLGRNEKEVIAVEMEDSEIRKKVEAKTFELDSNQLRILVLGDSYIYGGGIDPQKKFSRTLSTSLEKKQEQTYVLDVSKPANNTIDNYNAFKYYYDLFQPQIVFWAYNINDIEELEGAKSTEQDTKKDKKTENDTDFFLYKMPEFNLLGNDELFVNIDNSFSRFFESYPDVYYIKGADDFINAGSDFQISKYDGHPNEKAHERIARRIEKEIRQNEQTK